MKLTIDLESRSLIDLKKAGQHRYAEDPSTEILCIAVKKDDDPTLLWVPDKFDYMLSSCTPPIIWDQLLADLVSQADILVAHNVGFERVMWHEIMHKRYGFPDTELRKWRCTAAKSAALALPRGLFGASQVCGLTQQKDDEGHRVMLQMCKPRKPRKHEDPNGIYWFEDTERANKLFRYCMLDTEVEHELDKVLPDLPPFEQELWFLDQTINDRGIAVDIEGIKNIIEKLENRERDLLLEVSELTDYMVTSSRQVAKSREWIQDQGIVLSSLDKASVEAALNRPLPTKVRRFLEIRQSLGLSSVSKFYTMLARVCRDGRIKDTMMYHGAGTGRWAGKGIQPHNYPRDTFDEEDFDNYLRMSLPLIDVVYGCPIQSASKCLRGVLIAGDTPWLS